jgi:hypothetical protein
MAIIQTAGNPTHAAALRSAEHARQVGNAGVTDQATLRTNEATYFRACRDSCIANNNGVGAAFFSSALRELGLNA